MSSWASQVALVVKNPPANAGDEGSVPGLGRSPGEGNGYPLQYSCLGNSTDRKAWRSTVHGDSKSWTHLSAQIIISGERQNNISHVKNDLSFTTKLPILKKTTTQIPVSS